MKRIYIFFTLLFSFLLMLSSAAQVPESFAFQAVLRGPTGELIKDQKVDVSVTLVAGDIYPSFGYMETHEDAIVNENGLITLEIGKGTPEFGSSFQDIPWSEVGPIRILCTVTPHGSSGSITSHGTLHSVPFAMHAKTAESLATPFVEVDGSVENEIQELSVSHDGDTLYLSKSNWVIIPGISEANANTRLIQEEFTSESIAGNPLGNDPVRNVSVYLPPNYRETREYPVVYLLPGTPFDHRGYIDSATWYAFGMDAVFAPPDFPKEGFKRWMDNMISSGSIAEMIVVMPDASAMYGSSWYTNSSLNGDYESYISNDLVQYIDEHYSTIKDRDARVIMGHCVGGYGAIKIAMKHPDVFGILAANTPMLNLTSFEPLIPQIIAENPDGMTGPDPSKFFTSVLYALSAAVSPNLDKPPFYVDLPFEWPNPEMIGAVRQRWDEQSPPYMRSDYNDNLKSLNGFYFDWGANDEFSFMALDPTVFRMSLDIGGVPYHFEEHQGTHYNKLYERMEVALKYVSDKLEVYP